MKRHWIINTDPDVYKFTDLLKDRKTIWNQVNNKIGLKNLRRVISGDMFMIFERGNVETISGLAEAVSDAYQDPNSSDTQKYVFELKGIRKLTQPIEIWELNKDNLLKNLDIINIPELEIQAVSEAEWQKLLILAKEKV